MHSGIVEEKSWALSVDPYWLQVLQFSLHLLDLLSILLRCNGFAWIRRAVVDQMSSRPPRWEVIWSCFSIQPLSWSSLAVL